MKGYISTIATILMMVSCLIMPLLGMTCFIGFFVASFYLIVLIVHLVFPKVNLSRFINLTDTDSTKALKRKKLIFKLIPLCWVLMFLFAILNAWYQRGYFMQFQISAISLFIILIEISVIEGVKKWKALKWSGFSPILLGVIITCCFFLLFQGHFPLISKVEDLRFQHDFLQFSQLVKQIESKSISSRPYKETFPIPDSFPANNIWVTKTENGGLVVDIHTGSFGAGSNGIFWGYAYISDDHIENLEYVKKNRRLQPCWYWYEGG